MIWRRSELIVLIEEYAGSLLECSIYTFSMWYSVDEIFKYSVDVYTVPNNTDPIPQLCVVHICSQ